jgi:hypothetical protein
MQVLVDVFGEIDLGTGPCLAWRWRIAGGREEGAVIAVVIEDTGRLDVPPVSCAKRPGKESDGLVVLALV